MNSRLTSYLIPALVMLTCIWTISSSATERPNILLIVSEDNGPELGCYGEPFVRTPVLDRLAEEGVRFHNAYVPQAGCSQSRAAFLSGLYPHQNGQIGLATWKFRMYREDTPNIVRSLKQVGYRTGIIGKLHINPASAFPFDMKKIPSANFSRKNLGDYAKHAEEFFNAGDKPFFLSVNYPDAHRPFLTQVKGLPADPLTAEDVKSIAYFGLDTPELRKQTADYYNCLSRLDSQVGELLAALRASGKEKETLVVYLGDHGADMLRGKRTSYEGGVRVPLIVSWAGMVKGGQVNDALVSTLDLMPTFLDVAKAEPVDGLAGRTLSPLLMGRAGDRRKYLFTEYHTHSAHNFYPQRTVRDERFKLIHNLMPGEVNPGYEFTRSKFFPELREVVSEAPEPIRSAYERMQRPPEYELYDLQSDPYEFRNLANDSKHAATLTELKTQLANWRIRTNDPLLNADNLTRLKAEIDACIVGGEAEKGRLNLTYPDYFFTSTANATIGFTSGREWRTSELPRSAARPRKYGTTLSVTLRRWAIGRDGDKNAVDVRAVSVDDLQSQAGPRRTVPGDGDAIELGLDQPADSADLSRNRRPQLGSSDRFQQVVQACRAADQPTGLVPTNDLLILATMLVVDACRRVSPARLPR